MKSFWNTTFSILLENPLNMLRFGSFVLILGKGTYVE